MAYIARMNTPRVDPADHRSHGCRDDAVVPDWPALAEADVHALLAGFPALRGPVQLLWRSPRPFSAAARVRTRGGEVFVKRHSIRVRAAQALQEEHAFIAHLRAQGIPVPRVLPDCTGATAFVHGDWTHEVHALADGVDLYRDAASWTPLENLERARSAGRMLARLHLAAAGFDAIARSTSVLLATDTVLRAPDLIAAVASQCTARPALAGFLGQRDWQTALRPLLARHRALHAQLTTQPRLWTHGDWHASNLFWNSAADDAQVSAILDFGLCAPTFALYDLATAIERNAIAWLRLDQTTQIAFPHSARALIEGYAELRPLANPERALLADLLPLVHVDFALSEVEYFHAVTGNDHDAELAWSGFLLGHAAWFDTAPGQALLQAIRQP